MDDDIFISFAAISGMFCWAILTYIIIQLRFFGFDSITFTFNEFGEMATETILFPCFLILSVIGFIKQLKRSKEAC